jgi:hypothetical protein
MRLYPALRFQAFPVLADTDPLLSYWDGPTPVKKRAISGNQWEAFARAQAHVQVDQEKR